MSRPTRPVATITFDGAGENPATIDGTAKLLLGAAADSPLVQYGGGDGQIPDRRLGLVIWSDAAGPIRVESSDTDPDWSITVPSGVSEYVLDLTTRHELWVVADVATEATITLGIGR